MPLTTLWCRSNGQVNTVRQKDRRHGTPFETFLDNSEYWLNATLAWISPVHSIPSSECGIVWRVFLWKALSRNIPGLDSYSLPVKGPGRGDNHKTGSGAIFRSLELPWEK